MNSSIDHHHLVLEAVRTTSTYCAVWAGKLTVSYVPVPAQVATVVQALPLPDTSTL